MIKSLMSVGIDEIATIYLRHGSLSQHLKKFAIHTSVRSTWARVPEVWQVWRRLTDMITVTMLNFLLALLRSDYTETPVTLVLSLPIITINSYIFTCSDV